MEYLLKFCFTLPTIGSEHFKYKHTPLSNSDLLLWKEKGRTLTQRRFMGDS